RKPIDLDQLIVSVEKAFERLNTERALKYRTRELELTKQIVAKITEEKEIILDFRTMPGIPAMNFAKSILDNVPGGLVVLNRDLNILYMNHCVARIFGATPNKIDLEFVSKLSEFGITDLTYEMFISAFEQLINSTSGTLETIKTGKYSYMTLLRLKIMGEIQDHAIILITMRGERK
ncbi:MAG TPA: PAS domain-containing protein, partial [Deltaproteobacteria bacterium]|nr:PAS domain-containing protein [Deltaproteobacteria bacterium]